jgi:hypothetical protein
MKTSRQRYWIIFLSYFLAVPVFPSSISADTLVMPRDLVDFAVANHCAQIDDFYERPGTVNPPYVYGWLPGANEDSAVFWCKKVEKNEKPYNLMFKVQDPQLLGGCPAVIEWWNPPRGLSIKTRRNMALRNFHLVTAPQSVGPSIVVPNARVIVSEYDGVEADFYCHEKQWFVEFFE